MRETSDGGESDDAEPQNPLPDRKQMMDAHNKCT
jgi:hypothetical protein